MRDLYRRLLWPEYEKYLEKDGFMDHSYYNPNDDTFCIEEEWLKRVDLELYKEELMNDLVNMLKK